MPSDAVHRTFPSARTGAVVALAAATAIAIVPLIAPAVIPEDAPVGEFSAERAMTHVREIAAEPHPMGSAANARVGSYIAVELAGLGLEVRTQPLRVADYFGAPGDTVEIVNVAARLRGTASTGTIVLMAHYDSVPTTPGANDNAAGVAALLEAARALTRREPLRNDVIVLATDGEEPAPRYGANAYFDAHPWAGDSAVVVNFEAIGHAGPAFLVETTSPDRWLADAYAAAVSHPAAFSFLPDVIDRIGEIGTDFDVVRSRGIPGLHFAYSRGSPIYHTMQDDPEAVGLSSLQHHGEHAVGLATSLGRTDLGLPTARGDVVAFTVGRRLVSYSTGWAMASVALPLVGLIAALARRRRTRWSARTLTSSVLRTLGGCLSGAALGTLAWIVLTSLRSDPGVIESYAYLMVLMAGTALSCQAAHRPAGHGSDRWTRRTGTVTVWVVLAVVIGLAAPQTGYLFVWPALAGTVVAAIDVRRQPTRPLRRAASTALVAVPALVLILPPVDVFFQLAQPRPGTPDSDLAAMILVPLLLGGLTIELVRHSVLAGGGDSADGVDG
jgi:hypothetical protein